MRLLLIEDDDRVAGFVERGLKAEGYFVVRTASGKEGLVLGQSQDFNLIILDLMLPEINGRDVCQRLRIAGINTPIIMLTAMDSQEEIVAGLKAGADDYICKPFAFDELLARIEAVARRAPTLQSQSRLEVFGPIKFDKTSKQVYLDGQEVSLTAKEVDILALLLSQPGKFFSRERILNSVWGLDVDPLTNVIDVYIGKLRKKLVSGDSQCLIETKRGVGYRLVLDGSGG